MKRYLTKLFNSPALLALTVAIGFFVSVWYIDPDHSSLFESKSARFIAELLDTFSLSHSEKNHFEEFYESKMANPFFFPRALDREESLLALERKILSIMRSYYTGLGSFEEKQVAHVIVTESIQYGFDPLLILALIRVESSFFSRAVSYKNARGLMQIMPSVGESLAEELHIPWIDDSTLFNPLTNIRMGTYFLYKLTKQFKYNQQIVLAAYNWGPFAVANFIKEGKAVPAEYSYLVLTKYKKYASMKI